MESFRDYMDVREEVAQALSEGKPVVALESTIIAHSPPVEMAIAPMLIQYGGDRSAGEKLKNV